MSKPLRRRISLYLDRDIEEDLNRASSKHDEDIPTITKKALESYLVVLKWLEEGKEVTFFKVKIPSPEIIVEIAIP